MLLEQACIFQVKHDSFFTVLHGLKDLESFMPSPTIALMLFFLSVTLPHYLNKKHTRSIMRRENPMFYVGKCETHGHLESKYLSASNKHGAQYLSA